MAEKEARAHPQGRSAYRRFASFATRWRDNDQYGHMNNAVYYDFCCRVTWVKWVHL